nr:MAG TPA: hypothetical protein [Bacteriophage sp.]
MHICKQLEKPVFMRFAGILHSFNYSTKIYLSNSMKQ